MNRWASRRGARSFNPAFGAVSPRERRQADLFFADLMGQPRRPVPALRSRPANAVRPFEQNDFEQHEAKEPCCAACADGSVHPVRPAEQFEAEQLPAEQTATYLVDQGREGRGFVSRGPSYPGRIHAAQDIPGPRGTPVYAALDGVVIHARRRRGYGNLVILRHPAPDDVTTAYAHLDSLSVAEGAAVRGGQVIGTMGNTTEDAQGERGGVRQGMGVHLHFSVQRVPPGWTSERIAAGFGSHYEERTDLRVEPRPWLASKGIALYRERFERQGTQPRASEAFPAEQARAPALPTAIVTKWTGVDRSSIPKRTVSGTQVADTDWMGTLIDNSNLRFTGAYVSGAAPAGQPATSFTNSSRAVGRAWIPNVQTLADQGWGVVFFYVGYSVGGGEPQVAGTNRARGVLHGAHLRGIMNGLGPAWAGATVFIDNEDPTSVTLPANLIEYYQGIFEEMSRPDPTLAAFRPAFYGHGRPVEQMLARQRDMFIWYVQLSTSTTTTPVAPFTATVDPLTVDPVGRPVPAVAATPAGQQRFVSWSLGRQFWYYTGRMPAAGSAVATRLPSWRREATWDYNVSFVRNPAFPVAEPRLAAALAAGTPVTVSGTFVPRTSGATPTPPSSRLSTQTATGAVTLATAAGVTVEPDAPVALFRRGAELLLATVLGTGDLGIASRNTAGTWTAINAMPGTVPRLRRSRAVQGVSRNATDSQLFYIGSDDRIYVKRLGSAPPWTDGQNINADLQVHPFSTLAAETRGGDTVDLFFIDRQGLLATAFWARWFTAPFPGFSVQRLETTPSLLPGTALATTCPQANHLLVFGIGADLRLTFARFIHGQGWSAVAPIGTAQELLGPHSRLAAHAPSATEVEVAALTDSGQLVLYTLQLSGTTWTAGTRQLINDPPPLTGPAPAAAAGGQPQPADGFRINPFSDLVIFRGSGQTRSTVLCAGLRGGEARTLQWNAGATSAWQGW